MIVGLMRPTHTLYTILKLSNLLINVKDVRGHRRVTYMEIDETICGQLVIPMLDKIYLWNVIDVKCMIYI